MARECRSECPVADPPVSALDDQVKALYRDHGHRVLGYLARRVTRPEDAADLFSEVLEVTWRRRADLPPSPDDVLWVYGVARNVLANQRRAGLRRDTATQALARAVRDEVPPTPPGNEVETGLDLRRALAALGHLDREIICLTAWEGLTSAEVGAVLDLPPATVRSRLRRARAQLRQLLNEPAGATVGR